MVPLCFNPAVTGSKATVVYKSQPAAVVASSVGGLPLPLSFPGGGWGRVLFWKEVAPDSKALTPGPNGCWSRVSLPRAAYRTGLGPREKGCQPLWPWGTRGPRCWVGRACNP